MPAITSLEIQKKNKNRINVFVDGEFAFALSVELALKKNLQKGRILKQSEIEEILKKEQLARLQDIAIRFLNFRPRSEKEVFDHLAKKISQKEEINFQQAKNSPAIPKIIIKLKKYKLVNDLEFAKWFSNSRMKSNPRGLNLIKAELKFKGIEKDIIESVLKNAVSETELAKKAAQKRVERWKKLSPLDFKKKLYQFLLSRGFGYDTTRETFAYFEKRR